MDKTHLSKSILVFVFGVMTMSVIAGQEDQKMGELIKQLRGVTVAIIAGDMVKATEKDEVKKWEKHSCCAEARKAAASTIASRMVSAATACDETGVERWRTHPYYGDAYKVMAGNLVKLSASMPLVDHILKTYGKCRTKGKT